MKIGLQVVKFDWPGQPQNIGSTLEDIARTADQTGFASLWVMDHYYQIAPGLGDKDDPMLQAYVPLSYMAAVTERIHLGTMVTGVIYREPAYLVKTISALDVLSGGRAYMGIGAAWYEEEAIGLGFPFPRWRRGSNAWKRRCRLPSRCGGGTAARIMENITGWKSPSTNPSRFLTLTRRY